MAYLCVIVLCYSMEVLCVIAYSSATTQPNNAGSVFKPVLIVQEVSWLLLSAGSILLFYKFHKKFTSLHKNKTNISMAFGFSELIVVYAVQLVC